MRTTAMAGVIVGIISLTGMALADHVEPASATKAAFSLVNGFLPCNSPNTNTQTSNTPACAPAVPNDFCAFGPGGSGKLTIKKIGDPTTGTEDLKLTASATGLNAACESQDLHIRLSYRYTSDDCVQGSCTTEDVQDVDLEANGALCIVAKGKCTIKTTLSTAAPGLFGPSGSNSGVEILGCGLHPFAFRGSPSPLQCGILLK